MDAALWALRRAPRSVIAGAGLLAGLAGLVLWAGGRERAAFARGRAAATAGAVFDSALAARAAGVVALRTAQTDTVVQRVTVTRWRVESLTVALPPTVRGVPQVDTLVRVTQRLLTEVDTLTAAITAERAAWTERAKVDSAAIYALRVLATARGDSVRVLATRPTKSRAVWYAVTGVALGFLTGVTR